MKPEPAAFEHAMRQRMRETGEKNLHAYAVHALGDERELSALIDLIVVPETWFFRDAEAFSAATSFVAQRLRQGRRPVQVLSVPCATGEEPYSMAIALAEARIPFDDVIIDAIDVSSGAIGRARRGVYQRNAFRNKDLDFRDRYFDKLDAGHELHKEIRAAVRFRCANLLALESGPLAKQFDVIFCRNLLIYFDEPAQRAAATSLKLLLRDDGLLLSGYAETNAFMQHGFTAARFPKAFALTKSAAPSMPAAPPANALPFKERKPRSLPLAPARSAPATQTASSMKPHGELDTNLRRARETADAGNQHEAERLYLQCLQLAPDCAEAYFMLGLLHEQQQDVKSAAEHLRRAVYLDPDHYEALCHLALLAEQVGDADSALQFRRRAERVFHRRSGAREKS